MIPYASRHAGRYNVRRFRSPRVVRARRARCTSRPLLDKIYGAALARAFFSPGRSLFNLVIARRPAVGLSTARGYHTLPMQPPVTMRGRLFQNRRRS